MIEYVKYFSSLKEKDCQDISAIKSTTSYFLGLSQSVVEFNVTSGCDNLIANLQNQIEELVQIDVIITLTDITEAEVI